MQATPSQQLRGSLRPAFVFMGALFMTAAGCASLVRPWDLRVTSKTQRCIFRWTLAGHNVTLDITAPTKRPNDQTPVRPNPRPSSAAATPTVHLTYRVTDRQAAMLKRLVQLDRIRSLARRYRNVCAPKAPKEQFSIDTPSYRKVVTTQGFTPQAIHDLWRKILTKMPAGLPKPPIVASIPNCPGRTGRIPNARPRNAGTRPTASVEADQCVSDEVGLIHDSVDELWRGKVPAIRAIAPKNWKLVLRYRTPFTSEYFSVPMRPKGCIYTAILPSQAVAYWTLQYYIRATDALGKKADGSASADSPHIVTIRNCLETGK
ncbi:MAG: hypothetical protein J7M25_01605 [Deltaproteobacteria bacterium]|nr:hypothetical protein [Deltaproteobacteria bacterium]